MSLSEFGYVDTIPGGPILKDVQNPNKITSSRGVTDIVRHLCQA